MPPKDPTIWQGMTQAQKDAYNTQATVIPTEPTPDQRANAIQATGVNPSATATTPAQTGATGTDSAYYPRYTPAEQSASDYQNTFTKPRTTDEIAQEKAKQAQSQIDALNNYYNSQLQEQSVINDKRNRSTNAVSTLTGLAGSTEADVAQDITSDVNKRENKAIENQRAVAITGVFSKINEDAQKQANEEKTNARLDAETILANRKTRQEEAVKSLTTLAKSGVTAEGLKASDPTSYDYLAKQMGGEELLKASITLNRPTESVEDKKIENGKYVIAYKNPITGMVRIESVDLGIPKGYTKSIDLGDRIMVIPDNFDPAKDTPLYYNKKPAPKNPSETTGGSTGAGAGAYGSDLDAIIGATTATITSKFGQQTFRDQISRARNEGDKINLVASVVLGKADSATKTDFTNQAVGINQIDKAIKMLDNGAKTGVLEAGAQYTFNVLGKDFDPKLAELNQLITSAIQPYRNSVTGAAWGTQEDGEYQMLFGSTKYSPAELKQRLEGVKEILASKSATALNSYVNPMGFYDNPFKDTGVGGSIEDQKQELLNQGYSEDQIDQLMNS